MKIARVMAKKSKRIQTDRPTDRPTDLCITRAPMELKTCAQPISQKPQLKTDHQRVKSYQHFVGNPLRKDIIGSLVIRAITAGQVNKTSKLNINSNKILYSAALSVSRIHSTKTDA